MSYIESSKQDKEECIFCVKPRENRDEENLILKRGRYAFIVMNLYPYNTGHVMVSPYRHVPSLVELTDEEGMEVMKLVALSIKALQHAMNPHGFNVGANIGRIAGAGIAEHVHIHVVPRWAGDTNFMTVVSGTKVMPELITDTYKKLVNSLSKVE
ncbi:MAG TPA: HIT domain-containing protein [Candidatus Caldiarchaeum subterraneum]|uniref:HIT domain-containing protein n=1 Tax=Caldiarchaeum subterraneum TaxID=311458 RepID=A0A833E9W1_CALS0|nr:HIT domain-containing protein [Candidatus Caldarchaeum subterraneum]